MKRALVIAPHPDDETLGGKVLFDHLDAAVGRAVVDDDHLARRLRHHGGEAVVQNVPGIEADDRDGDVRSAAARAHVAA